MILNEVVRVVENVAIARDTFKLRVRFPSLADRIRPGQFLMLRLPGELDPLLGRAFALYDVIRDQGRTLDVDIVYLVVGKMTRRLANLTAGDEVAVWGPLGNGFPDYSGVEHLVMVAGGIGQTPFLALARQALGQQGYGDKEAKRQVGRVTICYGARTESLFAGLEEFASAGCEVQLATDDGSRGFRGFVTQLLERETQGANLGRVRWVGCGPEPMLHALASLAKRLDVRCDLSLETPMACGVGVCFSCVTKVQCNGGWDYRRVCVEGPVFDAASLVW